MTKKQKQLEEIHKVAKTDIKELATDGVETRIKPDREWLMTRLADLRVKGYSKSSLVQYTMAHLPVSKTRAYEIVRESGVRMGEAYSNIYTDAFTDSILFLENLKEKAIQDNNLKMTLEIQKELNKVHQLYVERQEITVKAEQPLFTDEDE